MTDVSGLLDSLSLAPSLPGAACAGRWELFDHAAEAKTTGLAAGRAQAKAQDEALRVCAGCPQLEPCKAWVDSLPRNKRPYGVVAGRLNPFRIQQKRKPESEKQCPARTAS